MPRAALLGVALMLLPAATPLGSDQDRPVTVRLGDGMVVKPYFLSQLDQAGFSNSAPGGQAAGANLRRMQLGGKLEIGGQVELGLNWDFAHAPGGAGRWLEAQASFVGLKPVRISAGIFKPQFSIESVQGGGDILLIERPAIVNVTRNLAASSGREAVQVMGSGPRWLAGAALTAGLTGPGRDSDQRAVVGRALVLPMRTGGVVIEVGASGQYVFRPSDQGGKGRSVSLSNTVELAIDDVLLSVSTGKVPARSAAVVGPEASVSWRNLLLQGEYYRVGVNRGMGRPDLAFGGWYVQAAWTLLGAPRRWDEGSGVWKPSTPSDRFDPRNGGWGALEVAARFSAVDLESRDVRGGRQSVWTVGVNYWPVTVIRLTAEILHADVRGGRSPRGVSAVAGRAQVQF